MFLSRIAAVSYQVGYISHKYETADAQGPPNHVGEGRTVEQVYEEDDTQVDDDHDEHRHERYCDTRTRTAAHLFVNLRFHEGCNNRPEKLPQRIYTLLTSHLCEKWA